MKALLCSAVVSLFFLVAGCGGSNPTSSGSGQGANLNRTETSIETGDGGVIYFVYLNAGTVGEVMTVQARFREDGVIPGASTGTLHWGDLTQSRVRDGVNASHIYRAAGTFRIVLQLDDTAERFVVGTVVVAAAPEPEPVAAPPALRTFSAMVDVADSPGFFQRGPFRLEALEIGGNQFLVNIINPDADSLRSGTLAAPTGGNAGAEGVLVSDESCDFGGRDFNASIVSISATELVLRIDRAAKADLEFTLQRAPALGLTTADCGGGGGGNGEMGMEDG